MQNHAHSFTGCEMSFVNMLLIGSAFICIYKNKKTERNNFALSTLTVYRAFKKLLSREATEHIIVQRAENFTALYLLRLYLKFMMSHYQRSWQVLRSMFPYQGYVLSPLESSNVKRKAQRKSRCYEGESVISLIGYDVGLSASDDNA